MITCIISVPHTGQIILTCTNTDTNRSNTAAIAPPFDFSELDSLKNKLMAFHEQEKLDTEG